MSRPLSIRSAARPFVARALRGPRGRRLFGLSVLLAALSAVLGTWLTLGTGEFERELRVALELEQSRYRQEEAGFMLIADSAEEAAQLRREVAKRFAGGETGYDEVAFRVNNALDAAETRLVRAAHGDAPRTHRKLQQEARLAYEAWSKYPLLTTGLHGLPDYNWYDADEVAILQVVVDRGMSPRIEEYASPLPPSDALKLTGVLAGGALLLLLLLAAPVLAGTQMAQETHENTLQPLAGSALRAHELAIGLTAGPLAVVGVLAAPQLLLMLAAAAAVGHLGAALAFVAVVLAGGAFLVMLGQLAGLALGKVRSPGLVGGGLAAILGVLGGVGVALAAELSERTAGTLALLPQAAASHSLAQAFGLGEASRGFGASLDTTAPVVIGAAGMLTFAFLGLRALARRVGNTSLVSLRRGEALVGAIVAMVLVTTANPPHPWRAEEFYLLNLGLLTIPLAILLMMRAPTGDVPPALRRTPVAALVGEFVGWAGLYLLLAGMLLTEGSMWLLWNPVALLYAGWFLGVAALLALRVAVAPMTFASRAWAGVCAAMLAVAFGHMIMWARPGEELLWRDAHVFGFTALSPLLGLVQALLTVAVPWTLLRALRRPASVAPAAGE
ncbi:hypothetical protein [Nannocystis bainbridge]|uniref:Uncharacterized protein n=1 Tax=Nannocystis bainbridge TaxID=2995303 RepID=A0ABT5DZ88_9BACT|nr:hypothetical protein [Nannocystis bainbridge]MDC0718945.1 hypothetical protein [Nannocystis bainbridge]